LTAETLEFAALKSSPAVFNVSLYKGNNSQNPQAPYGSKGIGEPPYSMGYEHLPTSCFKILVYFNFMTYR
jgi:xanthine dehydrogenase molybdopterin-binding subunit B